MTCIVFTPEMVAWDTLMSCENMKMTEEFSHKVQYFNGCIYGFAGPVHGFKELIEWHQDGADPDDIPRAEFTMLVMTADGAELYQHDHPLASHIPYPAVIGSGTDCAVVALHMGADAAKAVEVAMRFDPYTGGRVMTMDPRDKLKTRMKVSKKGRISVRKTNRKRK
jgi:hypothetical protein